ncbi:MAG: ABC transporter ATP-binding protein, partial [Kiloniellales bacterium]|nr:ABC transporter ATP-binding protein [Kiloniellales bacterium]
MLKVEGLRSRYGRIEVLHGIDLSVEAGEIVTLVGANGAGKTTLLRCLSGIQAVTDGSVQFEGGDITRASAHSRTARGLGHAPEGRQIFTNLTVAENLRLGAYRFRDARVARDFEAAYELFPILKDKRHQPAGGLSGGQQQMLAIARALMGRPRCLLLDEPSLGLAPILVAQILGVIKTLKSEGVTVFLVEQNAYAALAIADRAYVMETGQITMAG